MKSKVLLTSSALLLSFVIIGNIHTAFASVKEVSPQASVSIEQTKPVVAQVVATTPVPQSVTTQESAPIVISVPSNDDLIAQYGWGASPYIESIEHMISVFPQKFTDDTRVTSFQYLKQASEAYAVSNNTDNQNTGLTFAYILTRDGRTTEQDWNNILPNCQRPMNPTN